MRNFVYSINFVYCSTGKFYGNHMNTHTYHMVGYFRGFNFCGLGSLDDFVGLYFCGIPTLIT